MLLNGLFVHEDDFIQPAFRCDAVEHYRARVNNVDFNKVDAAALEINTWISEGMGERVEEDVFAGEALEGANLVSLPTIF